MRRQQIVTKWLPEMTISAVSVVVQTQFQSPVPGPMRSYSFYEAHTYINPGDDALDRTLTAFTVHTLTSQLATLSACMQFGLKFGAAVAPQDALAGVATAYASLVPTGSVVVMTTNLVRYFNPNKKPSPDFSMISAMCTGVAFRPACKVHIRGESM
eukprot:gene26673-1448_t